MKKITSLLVACICLFMLSCSNDDSNSGNGSLKLSGTVVSPNTSFPISRAKVKVYRDNALVAEKTTDALGAFEINNLPEGTLHVELSKGKFKRELDIQMDGNYQLLPDQARLDIIPKIAVVTGSYDEIEQVLAGIGLVNPITGDPAFDIVNGTDENRIPNIRDSRQHAHERSVNSLAPNVSFSFADLLSDPAMLANYDIIFLNCGASETMADDPVASANLKTFIEQGGIVYATDWMYRYVQSMFDANDYLAFSQPEKYGTSLTANAQVLNADLAAWLANQGVTINPTVQINDFLPSWQMVDTFNSANVTDWLVADNVVYDGVTVNNKSLAFTFQYGDGGVFYSSFHTHGDDPSQDAILQMMNYFVFELSTL